MIETRPVIARSTPARPSFREQLRNPRLWVWAVLGAIGLGFWRYGLDRFWPSLEADHGWLAFHAVSISGSIAIYMALAFLVRPFGTRPQTGAGRRY